ncbi:hypothetical protein ACFXAZ_28345 [Streptomyces sp. NPDC059477]|uniref:hypothetical protein n=1 Tax=Streptomyces sp. NPDC059477 TaxID=3346847 RepID=UPI0036A1C49B
MPGPTPLPGDRHAWLRAPDRRPWAHPLGPVAPATTLVAAAELLARVDRYGESGVAIRHDRAARFVA